MGCKPDTQPTLVVLAAGSGTRYGGLKQLDPVGPSGETLLECAVRDAASAGFGHFVLVVREEHASQFEMAVLPRLPEFDVQLSFQRIDGNIHDGVTRTKPWGTGHAVLCAKDKINSPFTVVNGDDWYGPLAYQLMHKFLCKRIAPKHMAMVGFHLGNTLSPNGTVSRGICTLNDHGQLLSVSERTALQRIDSQIIDRQGERTLNYSPDTIVSMNFWGFHPEILFKLEASFLHFTQMQHATSNAEFYLPAFVDELIQTGQADVDVLVSDEQWQGITYAEDRKQVTAHLHAHTAARRFLPETHGFFIRPLTGGLVHHTYRVDTTNGGYILQKFNQSIFKQPQDVRNNYLIARNHLESSNYPFVIPAFNGDDMNQVVLQGTEHTLWRISDFICGTECHQIAPSPDHVESAGRAYGVFLTHLSSLDPTRLVTTIPGFHDVASRSRQFEHALNNATEDRKLRAADAIATVFEQQRSINTDFKTLPVRATHNDCKLSNLLFDAGKTTVRAVIDWDTLMPGHVITDFGDMARTLCATVDEEERVTAKVDFDAHAYQRLQHGFLDATDHWLDNSERHMLANGAAYIIYEQAIRFLGDYLAGDVYYCADYSQHNLDRASNQLALLARLRDSLEV